MPLIVGLGNPGTAYALTRHNIGFMVVDALLQNKSFHQITKKSFQGELFKAQNRYYLKPLTFMNLSGHSVLAVKNFYKIEEIIVIHDDLDLPFGAIRFKKGGGHGGHNGLKSIDQSIGRNYLRVRMGIGKPKHGTVSDFVLGNFSQAQQLLLPEWIEKAKEAIEALDSENWQDIASLYSQKKLLVKDELE